VANTNNGAVEVSDVTCATVAATGAPGDARDASPSHRAVHRKRPGNPRPIGTEIAGMRAPDNPADIVPWINAAEYREDFGLNGDKIVNVTDLDIAVAEFGAGTVDDFPAATADSGDADQPSLNPSHVLDLPNRCGRTGDCHCVYRNRSFFWRH